MIGLTGVGDIRFNMFGKYLKDNFNREINIFMHPYAFNLNLGFIRDITFEIDWEYQKTYKNYVRESRKRWWEM